MDVSALLCSCRSKEEVGSRSLDAAMKVKLATDHGKIEPLVVFGYAVLRPFQVRTKALSEGVTVCELCWLLVCGLVLAGSLRKLEALSALASPFIFGKFISRVFRVTTATCVRSFVWLADIYPRTDVFPDSEGRIEFDC